MSRLDDELRNAFRREEPPVDFTARLLELVALRPVPKVRWWQRLAMLLEPPKLRWVAIGVTASLLLSIGAAQYHKMRLAAVGVGEKVAKIDAPPEAGSTPGVYPEDTNPSLTGVINTQKAAPKFIKRTAPPRTPQRLALVRLQKERGLKERELTVEGEAAKEKLMLALSIASSALSDAQKAVHDDGPRP